MKILISKKLPEPILHIIEEYGEILFLENDNFMPSPISHHPDSLCFYDNGKLIIPKNYTYGYDLFNKHNIVFEMTNESEGQEYPHDTLVNGFVCNNILFCGKYISNNVLKYAKNNNYTIVFVKQAYAHCSTIVLDNALITQDTSIYNSAIKHNIDSLLIPQGNISLPGYNEGFIGGSCMIIKNNVIFYGDISKHPSYNIISSFLQNKGISIKYVKNLPLTDFGGGIVIGE